MGGFDIWLFWYLFLFKNSKLPKIQTYNHITHYVLTIYKPVKITNKYKSQNTLL